MSRQPPRIRPKLARGATSEDWQNLVEAINARLIETPENILFIGETLMKMFPKCLPKKHWADYGIKLSYFDATRMVALAKCPETTDPNNLRHFPANRSTLFEIRLLAEEKPHLFQKAMTDDHNGYRLINPEVTRQNIRDYRKYGGRRLEDLREETRQDALADPAYQSGENIYTGDFSLLYDIVADTSVNLILTDPVWSEIHLYAELARLASAKLKPGGLCLAYVGQQFLKLVMDEMSKHLEYYWLFGVRYGTGRATWPRNIANRLRPILAFAKPPVRKNPSMLMDLIDGERDKRHHEWGHGAKEAEYFVEKLTRPKAVVLDPFSGGGQIPVACKLIDRICIATEKDPAVAAAARARVRQVASRATSAAGS